MKITVLNGDPTQGTLDVYLSGLKTGLETAGHSVCQLDLRDLTLRYCVGCWNCWVKTPGQCSAPDGSHEVDRAVINADFVIWASPLHMGFPTELFKRALDKHVPLIHPYIVLDQGEAHHLRRYTRYPRVGMLLEKETSTDERDLQLVANIHYRTALNLKTRLEFCQTTDTPPEALIRLITTPNPASLPLPARLKATLGAVIAPPKRLALFNGSPRGAKGNTPIFLREIGAGFVNAGGSTTDTYDLINLHDTDRMVKAFREAECVILGFPLYTDSMPAIVKHFIEALEPLAGRANNPPLGFVVQSGFPEALHSRHVERYLEKLAERLGSAYLGTVVKGNGEPVRLMPENMNKGLFTRLRAVGAGLAKEGRFDPAILEKIASPERFPVILHPILQLALRMPFAHGYFDDMLKKNGAFERRFDQPFAADHF